MLLFNEIFKSGIRGVTRNTCTAAKKSRS